MYAQIVVFLIIILTLVLFAHGKLRYDFVGLLALLLLVITQVIKPEEAFNGFNHPAVITVAAVLIISNALIKTGAVDKLVDLVNKGSNNTSITLLILMSLTVLLSAFMNNVGALAIIVPITIKIAKDKDIRPSVLLMPVAFASLLGGMITSIGTPPNLIISAFRTDADLKPFGFFAFAPVGVTLSIVGILFTSFVGYKIIPKRKSSTLKERFDLEDYLFEFEVTDKCNPVGLKLKDFFDTFGVHINVVSINRKNRQIVSPGGMQRIFPGDILIIRSLSSNLNEIINKTCLHLLGAQEEKLSSETLLKSDDIALVEVVLRNDSHLIGKTAVETKLRNRYNANLVAVSRKGISTIERLKTFKFNSGDILLLQAPKSSLDDMYSKMRALPLTVEEVDIKLSKSNFKPLFTISIFAISIIIAALNILPIHVSFLTAALLLVIFKIVTPREFYDSIEWPTIIMIGSLFTLGFSLESSGGSETIANLILRLTNYFPPYAILIVLMVITIILTNIINNTAATILMAPIAVSVALAMSANIDPFLMSVAVGASTSFLTPIGHQSNLLIMGPGGYKFTDYWKLGLPLTLFAIIIGIPLILLFFPF